MSYYKTSRDYKELLHQIKNGHEIIGYAGENSMFVTFSIEKGTIFCKNTGGWYFFVIMQKDMEHFGVDELTYFEKICEMNNVFWITNGK